MGKGDFMSYLIAAIISGIACIILNAGRSWRYQGVAFWGPKQFWLALAVNAFTFGWNLMGAIKNA